MSMYVMGYVIVKNNTCGYVAKQWFTNTPMLVHCSRKATVFATPDAAKEYIKKHSLEHCSVHEASINLAEAVYPDVSKLGDSVRTMEK